MSSSDTPESLRESMYCSKMDVFPHLRIPVRTFTTSLVSLNDSNTVT